MNFPSFAFVVAALASPATAPAVVVDAGTVQTAYVYELNPAAKCPALLDRDGRVCGVSRRFELRGIDRARALSLVNDNLKGAPKACAAATTHAVVFETTKGVRVVDVSFSCHTIGGRALAAGPERELGTFFRLYGLVNGLGGL